MLAGLSGLLLVAPPFFLEGWAGEFDPPLVNHPEYYYGFLAVTLPWQLAYLLIATDPGRFRPVILLGLLGKASFAVTLLTLFALGRASARWLGFAAFDAAWAVLFVIAYLRIPHFQVSRGHPGSG